MTNIDFNSSPTDLFKAAASAAHLAQLKLEEAKRTIAPAQAAYDNAHANLSWVASHPALANVDKGALYQEVVEGLSTTDEVSGETTPEPAAEERPKRKRRTKAEIEADKAREEAAETHIEEAAAYTSVTPAAAPAAVEAQEQAAAPRHEVSNPEPGLTVATFPQTAPAPAQAPVSAPPAAVAGSDPFDPFGVGA